jgi:hypothetical protein
MCNGVKQFEVFDITKVKNRADDKLFVYKTA